MFETINAWLLLPLDAVLGWLLRLPRDLTLLIVGSVTAALLTGVRVFTTNQDLLKRCEADKKRLGQLMKEAKKRKDKEALQRYQATRQQIDGKALAAEGKPMLWSLLPIALLAVWAFSRIAYLPPAPGSTILVKAHFPASRIGEIAHIVPVGGVVPETGSGWVQEIRQSGGDSAAAETGPATEPGNTTGAGSGSGAETSVAPAAGGGHGSPAAGTVTGVAEWAFKCETRKDPYVLNLRFRGETYTKKLLADGVRYSEPFTYFTGRDVESIEAVATEYRLFGIVPGFFFLQAWIIAYLIVAVPVTFLLKAVFKIS